MICDCPVRERGGGGGGGCYALGKGIICICVLNKKMSSVGVHTY